MDVIKAAVSLGLKAQITRAICAEEGCHTYGQLLQSAFAITSHLKSILSSHEVKASKSSNTSIGLQIATDETAKDSSFIIDRPRVAIMAKPCAEFVAGIWATWLCHGIAVPLALSHPEAELLHVLTDADVAVVMATPDYQARLADISQKCSSQFYQLPHIPFSESGKEYELKATSPSSLLLEKVLAQIDSLCTIEGQTPGLIIYTSGTTGKPKGAVHTHAGINAQVKLIGQAWEYTSDDCFLNCLPLHHVHGLVNALLAPLYSRAMVDFMPKFSVKKVWKRWSESYPMEGVKSANAITVFTGVPSMYAYLLQGYKHMDEEARRVAALAAQRLRLMMSGSSALPRPVMGEWERLTGHRLLERYGMTEVMMALSNPYRGERRPGTVGKPFAGVQVRIFEDDASTPGFGELHVKSPCLFRGYWHQPQVTKNSFTEEGYFKTGDYATKGKDGYFTILGRTSVDILKVRGYKLSALEIEAVLLEHPAIAECAVIGLPHNIAGETVCAVVVPHKDARNKFQTDLDLEQLQEWAEQKLAPYKIPSRLEILETMPRNAMGKVNKKELKSFILAL